MSDESMKLVLESSNEGKDMSEPEMVDKIDAHLESSDDSVLILMQSTDKVIQT